MNAVARERASPIQPVFNSHSFRLHISDFGVPLLAVGPGTKIKQTKKIITPGAIKEQSMRSHVGIVSWCSKGKDIERSTGENGRWKGVIYSHAAPTAAMPLSIVSAMFLCRSGNPG